MWNPSQLHVASIVHRENAESAEFREAAAHRGQSDAGYARWSVVLLATIERCRLAGQANPTGGPTLQLHAIDGHRLPPAEQKK